MRIVRRLAERAPVGGDAGDHRDYRRLVVLANHRSGSTMLVSAIDAHSRAVCYSEIFNAGRPMFHARGRTLGSRLLQVHRNVWPRAFLERFVFRGYREGIDVVGFKAFASQIRDPRFAAVLRETIADPHTRRIRLTRRNKLAQHLSMIRAERSGSWSSSDGKPEDRRPIRLEPRECAVALAMLERADRFVAEAIGGLEALDVAYEDFRRDPEAAFARVQEYLGLPVEPFRPRLRKQRTIPLSESIENWDELRAAFAGSVHAALFDDELTALS